MKPFCEKFEILFRDLFNPKKNADCLNKFSKLLKKENWDVLLGFIIHVQKRALTQITAKLDGFKGISYENLFDVQLKVEHMS